MVPIGRVELSSKPLRGEMFVAPAVRAGVKPITKPFFPSHERESLSRFDRIGVNLIIDFFIIVYSVMSRFIDTIIRYLLIKD